jgi:hypothetical protein
LNQASWQPPSAKIFRIVADGRPTASSSSFTGTPALARSAIAFANSSPTRRASRCRPRS